MKMDRYRHPVRISVLLIGVVLFFHCSGEKDTAETAIRMSREAFADKMKGAWAGQLIGVTYGFPVEFKYNSVLVPDSVPLTWPAGIMEKTYRESPGAYDDIYVELTFLEVYRQNKNASAIDYAQAFGRSNYWLWFANQMARNNIRNGIMPERSGHWLWNPECTSIDFQIEADFIGLLYPGLRAQALALADSVGHIMAYGDGYYGGVFVSQMYAAAFISDDIAAVIAAGLAPIPAESRFHRMISDVVQFHKKNPRDWKANWQYITAKYGDENGSPFAVFDPWNIEASMNAAHVVTGLLYGGGDFTQTMDIAARCGNDADCNPATAAGILGTIYGFAKIPAHYQQAVMDVYDWRFQDSAYALKDAVEVTEQLALANIAGNGGMVSEAEVVLAPNRAPQCELEVARPDHHPAERISLWRKVALNDPAARQYLATLAEAKRAGLLARGDSLTIAADLFSAPHEFNFRGNGFCIFGRVVNDAAGEWNFVDDSTAASVYIDGKLSGRVIFPIGFDNRRFLAFFDYTLEPGEHTVKLVADGERLKDYRFEMYHTILYSHQKP